MTNDEELREQHESRKHLIRIGNWAITTFSPMNLGYIVHYCAGNKQSYLVAYKYICAHCEKPVPDEIQALYLMLEDGCGFIDQQ